MEFEVKEEGSQDLLLQHRVRLEAHHLMDRGGLGEPSPLRWLIAVRAYYAGNLTLLSFPTPQAPTAGRGKDPTFHE